MTMTHSRRLILLVSCVLVAVAATAAVAFGVVSFGQVEPSTAVQAGPPVTPPVADPNSGVASVPADVIKTFGAFRRAQNSQDTTLALSPTGLRVLGSVQGQVGAAPRLARTVLSNSTATISLVPAKNGYLCMVSTAGGAAGAGCSEASEAETSGILNSASGASGELLYGAMPDGTHSLVITDTNGNTTPVNISADGGFAVQLAAPGAKLTYLDGNDQTKSTPLFVPPPPPPHRQ